MTALLAEQIAVANFDAAKPFDPLKHPRDAKGRFTRKGKLAPQRHNWDYDSAHGVQASDLKPGDRLTGQGDYEITRVEHGSRPHTVRLVFKGGARITVRDTYHVIGVSRPSLGGEGFFQKSDKKLPAHLDDPQVKPLVTSLGGRLHVAEDRSGWDTSAVQRHLRGLQEVPAVHRRFLARSKVQVYVGTRPVTSQDNLQNLAGQHPPGYPEGDTYDQCAALFQSARYDTSKNPEFGKPYNPPMTKPPKIVLGNRVGSGSVNTAAHETGHALDYALGESKYQLRGVGNLSNMQDFRLVYDRFVSGTTIPEGGTRRWTADPYFLQEADKPAQAAISRRGERETFAEAYAAWVHTAGRPSKFRAEEIMDALGFIPVAHDWASPATQRRMNREALAEKRAIGQALIGFFDTLDMRIKEATRVMPPAREANP